MLDAISNELVGLHRRQFGRGPTETKTFLLDNMLVCVMHDVFLPAEKTLIEAGQVESVRDARQRHQDAVRAQIEAPVARLTGRDVVGSVTAIHTDPDLAVEIFILGPETGAAADPGATAP
jgi:uncharacterized protein YbcI